MVTITRHVFINIIQTEHSTAANFDRGHEKKYELSCDIKISNSLEKKKVEKIGLGSIK